MAAITCPNCGRVNRPGAKVCAGCGTRLAQAGSPPPPSPTPPPAQPGGAPPGGFIPPRQPPLPRPAAPPPAPHRGLRLQLSRLQWALIGVGGVALLLCIVLVILLSSTGFFSGAKITDTPTPTSTTTDTITATATSTNNSIPTTTTLPNTPTPSNTPLPPTAIVVPPTSTPTATLTFTPPPATAVPTATRAPTSTFTPTPPTDTPPGTILGPGQTWYQNGMAMTLRNASIAASCPNVALQFEIVLKNNTDQALGISLSGSDWSVTDDQKKPYQVVYKIGSLGTDCPTAPLSDLSKNALGPEETWIVSLQVTGKLDPSVNHFFFTATKAGRITNAKWDIPVQR